MEGSRLITEHSNRVISESTKFKEEAEALVLSLEQEKDQLYQKFIAYKKQVQDEYAAKLIALQEREKYLSEKVDEYEKDINKHQGDLKHRTQTINKLATVNNELESALSQWPSFQNVLSQIDVHTKLIEEARFQIASPIKATHSPVKIQENKPAKLAQSPMKLAQSPVKLAQSPVKLVHSPMKLAHSPEKRSVNLEQVHHHKENDFVEEQHNQYEQNSPFTEEGQGLGVQPHKSVNDDKVSNTPETHVEDGSQTRDDQDKNEEAHNKLDMDPFQGGEPVEPLDNGWGIEETPLNDNEGHDIHVQEEHREQPKEEAFVEEPREEQYIEQPREEEHAPEQVEHREEPNYYQEEVQPNYEEPAEYKGEEVEPMEVNYGEPNEYREEQNYYQEEVQPMEVNYGEPTEDREEPAEQKKEIVQPLEVNYDEPTEYKQEEVQPLEINYEEPPVVREHTENRDFEEQPHVQHEIPSANVSTIAFTAVPAYRKPQKKKKKGKSAKKTTIGFRPTQAEEVQPMEVNYGEPNEYREEPIEHKEEIVQPLEVNYEGGEYKQEEVQPLEVNYGESNEYRGEPAGYREESNYYQGEVQPMEVNYGEPTEYREEPAEYKEEIVQPLEVNYDEPTEYKQEEVQPLEVNYDEPPVVREHRENRDFEEQPPVQNEIPSANTTAFTAVPAYRMPQKKKKGQPAKKPTMGFRPAQAATYNMPDQPQDLGAEPETQQHTYDYSNNHAQNPSYEEGERQEDSTAVDSESRPPVSNSQEMESKPTQFVPFGRNPLTQAKKSAPARPQPWQTKQAVPKANAFGQPKVPQNDVHTENNGAYYGESNEINMENPPAYENNYNGEQQVPSIHSVDSVGEGHGQEEGKNEINGHYQAPKAHGKKVKKAIKKKGPAAGSIIVRNMNNTKIKRTNSLLYACFK